MDDEATTHHGNRKHKMKGTLDEPEEEQAIPDGCVDFEVEFEKIAHEREARDKLQKKYDKLKRIYLKLQQKYLEKEEQKTQVKVPTQEVVTIKEEPEEKPDENQPCLTLSQPTEAQAIEKKNMSRIAPKRKCSPRKSQIQANAALDVTRVIESEVPEDDEGVKEKATNYRKAKGRRKSSKPRKKDEGKKDCKKDEKNDGKKEAVKFLEETGGRSQDGDDGLWLDVDEGEKSDAEVVPQRKKRKRSMKPRHQEKDKEKEKKEKKQDSQVFRCETCGKFLSSRPTLEKHYRIHTGERPYQCDVCGKSFNSLSSFTNHTRIHNGIKPYKCHYCEKSFTETSQRTTHERTHTGEKPYMCDLCGGRFSLRSSLVRHRRIHTGEKPYVCGECGAAYCQYTQLSHHKKKCGRLSALPTLTPLLYQSDMAEYQAEKDLGDGKVGNRVKTESDSDPPKSVQQNKDEAEDLTNTKPCLQKSKAESEKEFRSHPVCKPSERESVISNPVPNFQHFQPYVHPLNHALSNLPHFSPQEPLSREAMERLSISHAPWLLNNS